MTLEDKNGRYLSKPLNSDKTFFDISVNTDQIGMGIQADIPEKWHQHVHLKRLSDKSLVKKLNDKKIFSVARQ